MSHILDLAIVSLYGYATGLFFIGFTRIVVTRLFADKPATVQPQAIEPEAATIQAIDPAKPDTDQTVIVVAEIETATEVVKPKKGKKTKTANKEGKTEKILVIPVDNSIEPELNLEQLKEVAKALKIKGYQFYKDTAKLQAKIKEVKGKQ